MAVIKKISLLFSCECPKCREAEFPYTFNSLGDTVEECYKFAVKEGWIFLQGKDFLHCFRKECLLEEELWR